jgi:hypothetical protein
MGNQKWISTWNRFAHKTTGKTRTSPSRTTMSLLTQRYTYSKSQSKFTHKKQQKTSAHGSCITNRFLSIAPASPKHKQGLESSNLKSFFPFRTKLKSTIDPQTRKIRATGRFRSTRMAVHYPARRMCQSTIRHKTTTKTNKQFINQRLSDYYGLLRFVTIFSGVP